jgi:hypothetical protein
MSKLERSFACGTALTLLVLAHAAEAKAAGVAPAQATPAQRDEALRHFKAGKEAADASRLELAVSEFRASLEVVESPNTGLKLARALRDSGKLAEAWTEYRRTQDDARGVPDYARAGEAAAAEQPDVERKIALVTIELKNAPGGATLTVGGKVVAREDWNRPVAVTPGAVDAVLTANGAETARQSVTVTAGGTASITLTPSTSPVGPTPGEGAQPAIAPEPTPSSSKLRPVAYVVGGLGVAGMATFAVLGALAQSTYNDLENTCHGMACPPGHEDEISRGRTEQTGAKVALVTGAVGIAGGVTLFVLSLRSKTPSEPGATASMVVGPGWIGLGGAL